MRIHNPYDLYNLDGPFIKKSRSVPYSFTEKVVDVKFNVVYWYKDGLHHSYNTPAIEYPDGKKYWCYEFGFHRLGGPAIERPGAIQSEHEEYWVYSKFVTKEQHDMLYSIMELKGLL